MFTFSTSFGIICPCVILLVLAKNISFSDLNASFTYHFVARTDRRRNGQEDGRTRGRPNVDRSPLWRMFCPIPVNSRPLGNSREHLLLMLLIVDRERHMLLLTCLCKQDALVYLESAGRRQCRRSGACSCVCVPTAPKQGFLIAL